MKLTLELHVWHVIPQAIRSALYSCNYSTHLVQKHQPTSIRIATDELGDVTCSCWALLLQVILSFPSFSSLLLSGCSGPPPLPIAPATIISTGSEYLLSNMAGSLTESGRGGVPSSDLDGTSLGVSFGVELVDLFDSCVSLRVLNGSCIEFLLCGVGISMAADCSLFGELPSLPSCNTEVLHNKDRCTLYVMCWCSKSGFQHRICTLYKKAVSKFTQLELSV